ncbi:MAG: ABC transporter permease [Mucinivorans sp.]
MRKSILREIRRFGSDKTLLIITIVIPVILAVLYVAMFAAGTAYNLPIAIVDQDNTPTSRQLTSMITASPTSFVAHRSSTINDAKQSMATGVVDAIVYIPQNFESEILSGNQAEVAAWIDGTYITRSSLVERDLKTMLAAFNIGVGTQMLTSGGMSQGQALMAAYPVVIDKHVLFNPYSSYAYYLLPGLMPLVLIIMVALTTAYVVGSEFRYGTAREWIDTANGSISRALTAKLAPYLLIFIVISIFMNTLLYQFLGLPLRASSIGILFVGNVFLILSYMSLAVIFVALTSNMRFALSISGAYTIAAFTFAGLTFPHLAMYDIMAWAANLFPMTFFMDLFIEQGIKGAPLARSLGDIAAMGGFTLLVIPFLKMLHRKALGDKYYGKL